MRAVDMTKIYTNYKGKWVALKGPTDTTVVASAKTLRVALEKARKKGIENPLMTQIPKKMLPLVGCLSQPIK